MTARLTLRYLLLFAAVLCVLSAGAYLFISREYAAMLAPALGTPEGAAAYGTALRKAGLTIAAFDAALLLIVGGISWQLARITIAPLLQAQERERMFAADAAHALRSPLATISALAQMHGKTVSDETSKEAFDAIARASLEASQTVGDLLTLARSAYAGALDREPIDVGAVVRDVAREFESRAEQAHIDLVCEPSSAIVDADERRMREIARNLIENALRYAHSRVVVRVRETDRNAELTVWNDGEKIPQPLRPQLFKRFARGAGEPGGTGLGLAIVAWVAHAHGGAATFRDDGDGTEFSVTLPLFAG